MRPPGHWRGHGEERWRRHEEHLQRQKERWRLREQEWRRRHPEAPWGCTELAGMRPWWRMHAGLHWRIFLAFGVAIAVSAALACGVFYLSDGTARGVLFIPVGVVLWFTSGAIAFRLVRPLLQVIRVARDIGDGKLKSRLELGRHGGDLGVLSDSINDMAARIERQLADQRELLAAVSHEIRTPLGHMRILLETARESGSDPHIVEELEHEVLEVDRLVGQLLAGSRLDFDALDRRELDTGELAALALERAGVDLERLEVATEGTTFGPRVMGDPTLLARALANLIDNAEGHGGGLTCLRVRAAATDGTGAGDGGGCEVVFEVEDAGPGFASGELDRVFDSFYRGERRGHGSLGLGLALVKRIAQAHSGRAWAENRPDGGARLAFSLPQAPSDSA